MAAYYETGKYKARVTNQALVTNNKGNPEFKLVVKPIAFFIDGQENPFEGDYDRTIYLTLTDATLGTPTKPGWVLQTLQFLGFDAESFAQLDPEAENAVSFVGQTIAVRCEHEEYDGKVREKWSILRGGGGDITGKPVEKKDVRTLDAKFGKLLKQGATADKKPARNRKSATSAASPSEPTPDAATPQPAETDIPF